MLFNFLKKNRNIQNRKDLIKKIIISLNIPQKNKELYLKSLISIEDENLNTLYNNLVFFIEKLEIKKIEDINKENFSIISWMRKKEAEEKKEEINSFSFLLHNL